MKSYMTLLFVLTIVFTIGVLSQRDTIKEVVIQAQAWYRSDEKPPEEFTPIIGVWADKNECGGIEVAAVLKWYGEFYEYAPTLKPPIGGLLRSYAPTWWVEMPGAAK